MVGSRSTFPQQDAALPEATSRLVRRLVAAKDDPGKRRIRAWLAALGDAQLAGLGLTLEDIIILRGAQEQHYRTAARPATLRRARTGQRHRGHDAARTPGDESAHSAATRARPDPTEANKYENPKWSNKMPCEASTIGSSNGRQNSKNKKRLCMDHQRLCWTQIRWIGTSHHQPRPVHAA